MRKLDLDPDDLRDQRAFARKLLQDGPGGPDHLNRGLKKHTTVATAMDLMPSCQLKLGVGVAKCSTMKLKKGMEMGMPSLFNYVAQYGLKKQLPFYLIGGLPAYFRGVVDVPIELSHGPLPSE